MAPRFERKHRSVSHQIYLKPGIPEDDLLRAIWLASGSLGRPQSMFRRMLLEGLRRMFQNGDVPSAISEHPEVRAALEAVGENWKTDKTAQPIFLMPGSWGGPATFEPAGPPVSQEQPKIVHTPPEKPSETVDIAKDSTTGRNRTGQGLDVNLM